MWALGASDEDVAWSLDRPVGVEVADPVAERLERRRARSVGAIGREAAPVVLGLERTLPVLEPLRPLFGDGALVRGSTVGVAGPAGATSLAVALAAGASRAGSWVAVVGLDALGLAAVGGLGVDLGRLVLVEEPPARSWGQVVAALAEAVDVVVVAPPGRIPAAVSRRLAARARERGSVVVVVDRGVVGGVERCGLDLDLTLRVAGTSWEAAGGSHLLARAVEVEATGRRRAARPRRTRLWLPGPDGAPAPLDRTAPGELRDVGPDVGREVHADVG